MIAHLVLLKRFWPKVEHGRVDECWPWKGSANAKGYGRIVVAGRVKRATHVSWRLANGAWPEPGKDVCHTCDNPNCVNPAHLWLGSRAENVRDSVAKGRHFNAARTHCVKGHPLNANRRCPVCQRAYTKSWRERQSEAANA